MPEPPAVDKGGDLENWDAWYSGQWGEGGGLLWTYTAGGCAEVPPVQVSGTAPPLNFSRVPTVKSPKTNVATVLRFVGRLWSNCVETKLRLGEKGNSDDQVPRGRPTSYCDY
jgi:hypothetical protein